MKLMFLDNYLEVLLNLCIQIIMIFNSVYNCFTLKYRNHGRRGFNDGCYQFIKKQQEFLSKRKEKVALSGSWQQLKK